MSGAGGVAGDVAQSAVALAGLLLVFLGFISTSFDTYQKTEQATVRGRYQRRAWFAFVGFVLALASAGSAISAKLLSNECAALAAVVLIAIALAFALLAALFAVLDIK